MSKYCLILGAKSDIAHALAHVYAQNGWSINLAARGAAEHLNADVSDLQIRYRGHFGGTDRRDPLNVGLHTTHGSWRHGPPPG